MDEICDSAGGERDADVVPAKRPVMPCPHVFDRGANGEPVFVYDKGPKVLTEWLRERAK